MSSSPPTTCSRPISCVTGCRKRSGRDPDRSAISAAASRCAAVGVLDPQGDSIDAEVARRGIVLPNFTLSMLAQLGIRARGDRSMPVGEGGTSETTRALGEWGRQQSGQRVLVVVGPSHGRPLPPRAPPRLARRQPGARSS